MCFEDACIGEIIVATTVAEIIAEAVGGAAIAGTVCAITGNCSTADDNNATDKHSSDTGGQCGSGDKHPSTPVGHRGGPTRGGPMDVPKGTNEPTNIDGRDYTGHALDQMQGRGVTPAPVEDAIQNGTSRPDKDYPDTRTEHTSSDGRVIVITDTGTGRVITVQVR